MSLSRKSLFHFSIFRNKEGYPTAKFTKNYLDDFE